MSNNECKHPNPGEPVMEGMGQWGVLNLYAMRHAACQARGSLSLCVPTNWCRTPPPRMGPRNSRGTPSGRDTHIESLQEE
eukprot:scaffold49329_cov35-Tisochrysis_lutea.AAC.2